MQNTIADLNDRLFEMLDQLEEISADMEPGSVDLLLKKAKAVTNVSSSIISNANLALEAEKLKLDSLGVIGGTRPIKLPEFFKPKESVEDKKLRVLGLAAEDAEG